MSDMPRSSRRRCRRRIMSPCLLCRLTGELGAIFFLRRAQPRLGGGHRALALLLAGRNLPLLVVRLALILLGQAARRFVGLAVGLRLHLGRLGVALGLLARRLLLLLAIGLGALGLFLRGACGRLGVALRLLARRLLEALLLALLGVG